MLLSITQIKNINATRSAVPGTLYEGQDGVVYKGGKDGILIVYQKASETSISRTENVKVAIKDEQEKVGITQDEISNMIMFRV